MGAGSTLVRWGVDLADKEGLPTFLEASPMGYPVYRKHGYEDIDVAELEIAKLYGAVKEPGRSWGETSAVEFAGPLAEGVFRTAIMRRPAKKNE
jgi:hypothetical protein